VNTKSISLKETILFYKKKLKDKNVHDFLQQFLDDYGNKIALASSLGVEDQILTHMCVAINPKVRIFVLDTKKLHQETYNTLKTTAAKYNISYEIYSPHEKEVSSLESLGKNFIYQSIENRKKCCHIRKISPLSRALSTCKAWITGLRRQQSITRNNIDTIEYDATFNMIKLNPLADWTEQQVWSYVKKNDILYNSLHNKGYPSIGCQPCTKAIKKGESIRSGRWWWEQPEHKECGLHKS
jgi:phosphoadenosine phosphosulfate reductase